MKRYVFYKSLKSILTPLLIFYTIIINFILKLSFLQNEFNMIMKLINELIKKSFRRLEKTFKDLLNK